MSQRSGQRQSQNSGPGTAEWIGPSAEGQPGQRSSRPSRELALLLVERQQSLASRFAGDGGAGGLHANHRIFKRAEAAGAGLVQGDRNRPGVVNRSRGTTRANSCEVVAALDAAREHAVNQTGAG